MFINQLQAITRGIVWFSYLPAFWHAGMCAHEELPITVPMGLGKKGKGLWDTPGGPTSFVSPPFLSAVSWKNAFWSVKESSTLHW